MDLKTPDIWAPEKYHWTNEYINNRSREEGESLIHRKLEDITSKYLNRGEEISATCTVAENNGWNHELNTM